MGHLRKILIIVIYLMISLFSFSQTDTEFWFVAPEVTVGHGDSPISFRFSSFGAASTVTLYQPANPAFTPIIVNIPADGLVTVDVTAWKDLYVENKPWDQVNNLGFHILATNPITAYYEVERSNNPDIFTLKGRNALGTNFIIPSQNYFENKSNLTPDARSSFEIVATEDNTTVTITPTNTIEVGHNTSYTVTLNRGETYSATAASRLAANHLFGTKVISDKPIAITIKDDSVYGNGCYDLMGDQLVPIELLGTEYIAIQGNLTSPRESVYINAVYDNTEIYINGNPVAVSTINGSGIYRYQLTSGLGTSNFIETSKPAYVLQVTGFGCETGEAVLPPAPCTGSSEVAFARTSSEGFGLILFTENASVGDFTVNSGGLITNLPAGSFNAVPGSAQFSAALFWWNNSDFSVIQQSVQTTVSNSTAKFHCGVINGGTNTGCRYGYFSNYNTLDIGDNDFLFNGCGYNLDAGNDWTSFLWNTGETTQEITAQDSGWYWVDVSKATCSLRDSIYIEYIEPISLGNDTSICYGDSITLDIGAGYSYYEWSTGMQGDSIPTITVSGGTYSVTVTDANNCTSTASIKILAGEELNVNISGNDVKCVGQTNGTINLSVTGGFSPYFYVWDSGQTTEDIINLSQGTYNVTVTDGIGCAKDTSIVISEPSAISVSSVAQDISCYELSNGAIDITASGGISPYSFVWDNGETTEDISGLLAGYYTVTVSDANLCNYVFTDTVTRPASVLSSYILENSVSCKGGADGETDITVTGGTSPYSYNWSTGATTENISGLSIGNYQLTVTDANNCTTVSSVEITEPDAGIAVSYSVTQPSCNGGYDGVINLTVSGGTPEYSFIWDTGQNSEDLQGMSAGAYNVTVTDAKGCTASTSVTLDEPDEITISASINHIVCFGANDGSATIVATGGTSPYTYLWSNGETTDSISGLAAGTYGITVTDSKFCKNIEQFVIN